MDDVRSNDTIYILTDNSYAYIFQKRPGSDEDVKPSSHCDISYNFPTSSNTIPVFGSARPITKDIMTDAVDQTPVKAKENNITLNTDKLEKLRNSTKQLLCLIEELQSKTHSSKRDDSPKLANYLRNNNGNLINLPPEEIVSSVAVKTLEIQTKTLDDIYIQDKKDDCSVYKRLTRECHCLNNTAYNDFIIHFNEDTKYITTTRGEIIKNIKIIKKFLYMGGAYTKNALTFLHDGLMNSQHSERLEIVQACVYADVCNVFDDRSMVTICILLPEMYETYGDSKTQKMAADILAQLIHVEEGRRYLTFTSKITSDIKKLLKKKPNSFSPELTESLNMILSALNPPLTRNINVSYYTKGQEGNSPISTGSKKNFEVKSPEPAETFKKRQHLTIAYIVDKEITDSLPAERGSGFRTLQTLSRYKMYLTVDEITIHLEVLHSLSQQKEGKKELLQNFDLLLKVFKEMLLEYDISELNIAVTNTLLNLMTNNNTGDTVCELPKAYVVSEISTEPVRMKSEVQQAPSPRKNSPHSNRNFGTSRNRVPVLIKVPGNNWDNLGDNDINKSTKGFKRRTVYDASKPEIKSRNFKGLKSSVIVIPIEKNK